MRVLIWNLWWRYGPWERRRDAIAATMAEVKPDLCGLFCTLSCLIDPPRAHRWQVSCAADGVGPVDVLRAHVAQDACGAVWESGVAPLASD